MAELVFEDLSFEKEKDRVKVNFLKMFYFHIEDPILNKIGKYEIKRNSITFNNVSESNARKKFDFILNNAFKSLKNKLSNKTTYYIHQSSGIPLMGTNYFGVIDRGTNIIEVKPLTSCNISCVFCSVDEGPKSRRKVDFVVEKDYLVDEFRKLVEFKWKAKSQMKVIDPKAKSKGKPADKKAVPYGEGSPDDDETKEVESDNQNEARIDSDASPNIDAHINAQGEPTLYAEMVDLVRDIMSIPGVKTSSIDTNGLLLTKQYIDELAEAGLTRINLSLHAMDPAKANELAGHPYNLAKVLDIARYIPTTKMDLIIVPVWMPGYNDEELPKLAKFAREIGAGKHCPPIGIQNMLNYKFGRNPVKQVDMDQFYAKMRELEAKYGIPLIVDKYSFEIEDLPELPKPFKKGKVVEAEIMLPGRLGNEKLAVANGRIISIPSCDKEIGSTVKVRIRRTKHNIFMGELLG